MRFIGLDAGSVSVKLVVFDEKENKLFSHYERHKGHPISVALKLLKSVTSNESQVTSKTRSNNSELRTSNSELNSSLVTHDSSLSITGSAGRFIASILGIEPVN
jgi:hypothetical protein